MCAKIIIYTFTGARLLCWVCYETPCTLEMTTCALNQLESIALAYIALVRDYKGIIKCVSTQAELLVSSLFI